MIPIDVDPYALCLVISGVFVISVPMAILLGGAWVYVALVTAFLQVALLDAISV